MNQKLDLNTHSYDGRLGDLYRSLKKREDDGETVSRLTMEESFHIIDNWINDSTLSNKDKQAARITIKLIEQGKKKDNYDSKNKIDVNDLLPRVVKIVKTYEKSGIDVFLKTFSEIKQLGSCAQGRTTRLLQFYIPYYHDDNYKK